MSGITAANVWIAYMRRRFPQLRVDLPLHAMWPFIFHASWLFEGPDYREFTHAWMNAQGNSIIMHTRIEVVSTRADNGMGPEEALGELSEEALATIQRFDEHCTQWEREHGY
ncbi:hypothetical protein EVJ58_g9857 [Rhodofomes roseus]|uniref:Uncharacterized protein n=1 Tax=Rhodofomes roseus TaxID=34475 RepID=A0A4Y9XRK1_9APHY|nr:hypothetical protein EVJ58_g9857 [Rhodofomes roseus]